MRFLADGPDIPQALLELRDSGQVVFFCGAGVSIPAGFPSFLRLTEFVIGELDVASDAPGRRLLERIPYGFSRVLDVISRVAPELAPKPAYQRLRVVERS
jgi:hypothetical protein